MRPCVQIFAFMRSQRHARSPRRTPGSSPKNNDALRATSCIYWIPTSVGMSGERKVSALAGARQRSPWFDAAPRHTRERRHAADEGLNNTGYPRGDCPLISGCLRHTRSYRRTPVSSPRKIDALRATSCSYWIPTFVGMSGLVHRRINSGLTTGGHDFTMGRLATGTSR